MIIIRLVQRSCLASILSFSGCAAAELHRDLVPGPEVMATLSASNLPEVAPRPNPFHLEGLPPAESLIARALGGPYRGLGGDECLALAASGSTSANLLESKAKDCCPTGASRHESRSGPASVDIRKQMLTAASLEARNKSTGTAMELFFSLGQALAQRNLIQASLGKIDEAIHERDQIKAQGLTIPAELGALQHRRADMMATRLELDDGIPRLSAELKALLNLGPQGESWVIWPLVSLRVDVHPFDPEAAVQLGLSRRPEVTLLRQFDQAQSPETIRSMQSVLGSIQPLLAMNCRSLNPSAYALICKLLPGGQDTDTDFASVQRVWHLYRLEREQAVAREIRGAAFEVRSATDQVILANDGLNMWLSEGKQLHTDQEQGIANFASLMQTELKILDARSTLTEKIFAWQIAVIKLRQAQFTLLP
jgi:hypothetical protein